MKSDEHDGGPLQTVEESDCLGASMTDNEAYPESAAVVFDWLSNSKLCFHTVNNLANVTVFSGPQWVVGQAPLQPCQSPWLHIFKLTKTRLNIVARP